MQHSGCNLGDQLCASARPEVYGPLDRSSFYLGLDNYRNMMRTLLAYGFMNRIAVGSEVRDFRHMALLLPTASKTVQPFLLLRGINIW